MNAATSKRGMSPTVRTRAEDSPRLHLMSVEAHIPAVFPANRNHEDECGLSNNPTPFFPKARA